MSTLYGALCGVAVTGLAVAAASGLWAFGSSAGLPRIHLALGIGGGILAIFANSAVFVYMLGTGRWIKEEAEAGRIDSSYDERHKTFKKRAFPWAMSGSVFVVAAAVLGGVVATGRAALWLHPAVAILALAVNFIGIPYVLRALRGNGQLLNEVLALVLPQQKAQPQPPADAPAPDWPFIIGISAWLPWLYGKFIMAANWPVWPFALISGTCAILYLKKRANP